MRRPVWRPSLLSRVLSSLRKRAREHLRPKRVILAVSLLVVVSYTYIGTSLNSIVIEPISVPRRYEDAGLTPEVMSQLIADALAGLEAQSHSKVPTDRFVLSSDPSSLPDVDVEVPGIKFRLRAFVEA